MPNQCQKHTCQEFVTGTFTTSTMTVEEENEELNREVNHLKKLIKKQELSFTFLIIGLPLAGMFGMLVAKSNLLMFIAFMLFYYLGDRYLDKVSNNSVYLL